MDFGIGLLLVGLLIGLVMLGAPIGVTLILLALCGTWALRGDLEIAIRLVGSGALTSIAEYVFSVIPLFVLMGTLVSLSGVGRDTFSVAQWLLQRVQGGLGVATVAANALFAAVTGVSVASASLFSQVAVPPMIRFGYSMRFAVGVVAGSSILGMLIPPSILMIVYGVLAEVSIGRMFLAGVIPGVVMSIAFIIIIVTLARFKPEFVYETATQSAVEQPSETARSVVTKLLPITILIVLVLGGIYGGVFTPTEAGAAGALGALAIAGWRRSLDRKSLWGVLVESGHVSVGILFLLMAASLYSRMLTMAGVPGMMAAWISELGAGPYGFFLAYVICLLILGMFLDSVSILLIVTPIAVPIAKSFGIDLVHFGIVSIVAVEIGLLTPPFGLSVFAVQSAIGVDRIRLETIFAGSLPFVATMFTVLWLLIFFPSLSTWLAY
jgi:tripartite ATP-independent transporter DctM subunit